MKAWYVEKWGGKVPRFGGTHSTRVMKATFLQASGLDQRGQSGLRAPSVRLSDLGAAGIPDDQLDREDDATR